MPDDDDNDLDLEPMNRGRFRTPLIALALLGLGVGIAVLVNGRLHASRRADALASAATAWNQLRRCLVGTGPPAGETPSAFARRIEIGLPSSLASDPPAVRARAWPQRCALPANALTRALFDAGTDDEHQRLLAGVASTAAAGLEAGELRTGRDERRAYLDELFSLAERARLPAGAAASGPLPPSPARPLLPRALEALFAGHGTDTEASQDPVPARALRVVSGFDPRWLCTWAGDAAQPARALVAARCRVLPRALGAAGGVQLVAADDRAGAFLRVAADVVAPDGAPVHRGVRDAFAADDGAMWLLRAPDAATPSQPWQLVRERAGEAPRAVPVELPDVRDGALSYGPALAGDRLFALVRDAAAATGVIAAAPDAGAGARADAASGDAASAPRGAFQRLYASGVLPGPAAGVALSNVGAAPVADAAPWILGAPVAACRTPEAIALAVHGADDRVAVTFGTDAGWSPPVTATVPGATLTCRGREATFTWTLAAPSRVVHQVRCTAAGCEAARATLLDVEGHAAAADVDGRVLVVSSPGPGRGLRMRLAPIRELGRTDDVVVLDDAAHGGLGLAGPPRLYARGPVAVVLVTSANDARETYAVRIDAAGEFAPVRVER